LAARERAANLAGLGADWPADLAELVGRLHPTETLDPWGELVIHDAHSTGHAALWLPQDRVLLAGDMLSDLELPLLAETGADAYDAGLAMLQPYVRKAAMLVPGHGSPTAAPLDRWLADRRYLDSLLAGRGQDDPRLADPQMVQAHADNLAALTGTG
jgi:glyoxylase-like metal-dependent hydrolase (beta-lactamase superfamily II)